MEILTAPTPEASAIRDVLRDGKIERSNEAPDHPLGDYCYVASEAYYHMVDSDVYTPEVERVTWEDETYEMHSVTHWYLRHDNMDRVVDLTAGQFEVLNGTPEYEGTPKGFLTRGPSKRAERLMELANRKLFDRHSNDSFFARCWRNSYVSC